MSATKIVPDGFLKALVGELVHPERGKQNRDAYIKFAEGAASKAAFDANNDVLTYLESLGLEHLVTGQKEPERSYLLEALRVIGIRFRRFAQYGEEQFLYLLTYLHTYDEAGDPEMDKITW